ncbi:MAG: LysE family translocator [Rhodospirillales bacterium]|nr:LysE family translocator [Rhodospirillales bacterium]MBO6785292.1 LysE family translocator [Rhodospirillales bacterium]
MPVDPELYAAFILATALLILMPGPIVTLVIANSLKHGAGTGIKTVIGANSGTTVMLTAGALGLTTVLAVAADVFEWIRWAGVAYLVWLGAREWREVFRKRPEAVEQLPPDQKPKGVFWHGFVVAITNPKTIFFFVAFFPQFIDPARDAGPQVAILCVTFMVLAFLLDGMYAIIAGRARAWLAGGQRARLRHGITGTLLLGTGLGLALARRGS